MDNCKDVANSIVCISLSDVERAAADIEKLGRRCYDKAMARSDYDQTNLHRASTLDGIEGLKTLLILVGQHKSETYRKLTQQWDSILDWP